MRTVEQPEQKQINYLMILFFYETDYTVWSDLTIKNEAFYCINTTQNISERFCSGGFFVLDRVRIFLKKYFCLTLI